MSYIRLVLNQQNWFAFRNEIGRLLKANRRLSLDMIADVSEQSADDLIDGVSSSKKHSFLNRFNEDIVQTRS